MNRILMADDEVEMCELIYNYLTDAGYDVTVAADGMQAWELFEKQAYDLVLLDIMMPKIDGYGVCELIRKKSDVPVVFLTALDGEEHQLMGYDSQADDYVTKPFSMPVLLKKIAAIMRRKGNDSSENLLKYKNLIINRDVMEAKVDGKKLSLTIKEFEILYLLVSHPGFVYTRDMIIDAIWKDGFAVEDRVVDSHIKNLRQKIGEDYIETVRGMGYRAIKE